jgi:hypothetical protein
VALTLDYLGGHPALAHPGGVVVTRVGAILRVQDTSFRGGGATADIPVTDIARVEVLEEGERLVKKGRSGAAGAVVGTLVAGPVGTVVGGLARRRAAIHQTERVLVLTTTTNGREYVLRFKPSALERSAVDAVYARLVALTGPHYDPSREPAPLSPWVGGALAMIALFLIAVLVRMCSY